MKLLNLTLDAPAANLALDEALLESAESQDSHPEVLRIWEPNSTMVVLGRSSPIESEVNLEYCRRTNTDVFRRCSGGQSIATGPGCLMYAVLLDYRARPELRLLEKAHFFVMNQMQLAIQRLGIATRMLGTSDLNLNGRKFSGNSLRCKRNWLVYHGTMICDFAIETIADCLGTPIRQPDYRQNRSHNEFLTQLPATTSQLSDAIIQQWATTGPFSEWPDRLTDQLMVEKYLQDDWTYKI